MNKLKLHQYVNKEQLQKILYGSIFDDLQLPISGLEVKMIVPILDQRYEGFSTDRYINFLPDHDEFVDYAIASQELSMFIQRCNTTMGNVLVINRIYLNVQRIKVFITNDLSIEPHYEVVCCKNCKYHKTIIRNKSDMVGIKCTKNQRQYMYYNKTKHILRYNEPVYNSTFLYSSGSICPSFIWKRDYDTDFLVYFSLLDPNCYFCHEEIKDFFDKDTHIHHLRELSQGGSNHYSNLVFSHGKCHELHHKGQTYSP